MRLFRLVVLLTAAAIIVFSAGIALAYPPANAVRALPDTVERGETFNVTVNFTAPANNFSAPALTDFAPDGWYVTSDGAGSEPPATPTQYGNNMADLGWWYQSYPNGYPFKAKYKVTVPCSANLTNYTFDEHNWAYLVYQIGSSGQIWENITGNPNVTVVPPAICSTPSIPFYAVNGTNPQNKTLELWSSTPCMIIWNLTDDAGWLEAYPINGSCNYTEHSFVNLSVNSSDMDPADYSANITIEAPYPKANNSPRIVPVTLHVTDKGILNGQVDFCRNELKGGSTWETPLVVRFFNTTTKVEMGWSPINRTTDAYGNFTIEDVYPGTYDIGIKNCTCLSELNTSVAFTVANITLVDFGETREGDATGDDLIDSDDFSLMSFAYNTWPNDPNKPNWDPKCDFDRDNVVDSSDFSLLSFYYNTWGALYGL